uniref:Uncharacterized protein n=1 Tax=Wuchereria bancrofti TaxID=6293 RepID=A0A1I8EYT2_WUCBA
MIMHINDMRMRILIMIPVEKSSEMEMGVEHEQHIPHHHESQQTIGKINDELRFSIIDAVKIDTSGKLIQPRWKYFSAMMFLDRLGSSSSLYSGANTSVYDEINDAAFVRQESFLGKRSADGNLTTIASGRNTVDGRYRIKKAMISTSNTVDGESAESTVFATEDEYSAFCNQNGETGDNLLLRFQFLFGHASGNSLIYPLRKIGSMNRLEYVKLQKVIHDAIHDKQMELLENESKRQ